MTSRTPLRPGDPLPEGWRWVRLGEMTTLIKKKIDPRKFPDEEFSLYSFPAYDTGQKPEVVKGSKIGSTKTIVQPGTVLFARLNPRIPRVWLVGQEHVGKAIASTEFLALFPTEPVNSKWLLFWLLSPRVREKVRSEVKGATKSRERISAEQVLSLDLPLPPPETQRRIVAWLDEAFSHLQAIKERHAQAEREAAALLPAKLAEVFGRAEKEGWRWVRLGEVATKLHPGFASGKKSTSEGVPHLRMHNITASGELVLRPLVYAPDPPKKLDRYLLLPGDVLFNNTNSPELVGKTTVFKLQGGKYAFSNHLTRISLSNEAEPEFVAKYFQFLWNKRFFQNNCTRWVGQAAFNTSKLKALSIPLPPIETQRHIVQKIKSFEEEARRIQKVQEESRTILEQLEKSLLSEAFRPERWT